MTAKALKYSIDEINEIIFGGFNYELPSTTLNIISELSLQVGSPDYVKTPNFQKRENPMKIDTTYISQKDTSVFKRKKGNKSMEVFNNEDWESLRSFQTTKIEEKVGIDAQIDIIRTFLNKLSDKNYMDIKNKIIEVMEQLIIGEILSEDMLRVSNTIFDIASTNRFYSKIYADIYSDLANRYHMMKELFEINLEKFTDLFNIIEYVDPNVNYDKFCEINKNNEKRKALGMFYLNLMNNGSISKIKIITITRNLLYQIYSFISQENKKNEVDEITENIALLYKKELYDETTNSLYEKIDGYSINEVIEKIANSKVKDYKSLTNKSLFKFMDMIDM